ncbi:FMN-binding protein [Clostridium estertheticum]|uniref:FMN-binding protein n=1 Tax=Clostridium estertheticum TaxID=238834 RepID=UPI001C6E5CD1|nr:FMN-binding protein [Clostridium estertheticum]MBW9153112.1 FMN-binding protein [Clostridium estertheticum]WLC82532.1 FMN-binding protein [Clostridium estertheticum]
MVKKIKKTQIFRHIIQLIMFVLSPGLFILAFSELKSIYTMIIKGNFNFITAFPTLIEFTTVIIATVFLGRFFCGWVCAFGTYNDFLYLLSKKVFKINFKVNEEVDKVLKYVKYVVLLLLVIVVWTMGSKVLDTTSPWDAFAQITNFPQVLFDYTIGVALLLLITIGALFVERFFCRYLCPLGAVFNILSKIGILKIKKPSDKCGKCRLCTNNCSMGLSLYKVESVCGGDCINCFKCIEACPRSNTKINVLGENVNPELASGVAIAAMVGLYAVNNLGASAVANSGLATASTTSTSTSSTSQKYKDGTYTGTGTGFHGATTEMSVTIKNNKITKVETVSNGDTPDFYARAESTITSEIISNQSTSVDTVSGATYTSEGIINATQEALKKAEVGSSATNTTTTPTASTDDKSTNTANTATTANTYKDGTYTGSGSGFHGGTTQMSVTIKDNKITKVETVSNGDTPDFYARAESTIISQIVSTQSTTVDTVSGATYSSEGIISATQEALSKAKA